MKRTGRIIGILICASVLLFNTLAAQTACFPWKPVHPVFDSLASLLDTAAGYSQEERESILKELENISLSQNNAILNIRYRYWNASLHGEECISAVKAALQCGVRLIDTASAYGNEAEVGQAIRESMEELGIAREEIFVITKITTTNFF